MEKTKIFGGSRWNITSITKKVFENNFSDLTLPRKIMLQFLRKREPNDSQRKTRVLPEEGALHDRAIPGGFVPNCSYYSTNKR